MKVGTVLAVGVWDSELKVDLWPRDACLTGVEVGTVWGLGSGFRGLGECASSSDVIHWEIVNHRVVVCEEKRFNLAASSEK